MAWTLKETAQALVGFGLLLVLSTVLGTGATADPMLLVAGLLAGGAMLGTGVWLMKGAKDAQ